MPRTFTRNFRVRYYECDAYGHLNNTNYIRYMEEAAFDASTDAGFGFQRYTEMERVWLVHQTEIEYLRPVQYNETVAVKTWVADFRRVSSRRRYEFRLVGSDEIAAQAHTDWVFVDTRTGRPTPIPPEVSAAYYPEGAPETFPPREPFPSAPPPPPGIFKTRRRVAWQDIDTVQHVNNAVYLSYIGDCGMQAIAAHNWPWQRMAAEGFAIILRRTQVQYLQPALYNDELEVSTWVSNVRRSTAVRHYAIHRVSDGALLVQAHTLGVWLDLKTYRPIRIPSGFLADFAPNIAETAGSLP